MIRKILFVAALAALHVVPAKSAQAWDTEFKVEESVYQTFHLLDIAQTVYIAKHPNQFYEKEIDYAIGHHPSTGGVIAYMAADGILHAVVTDLFIRYDAPKWATRTWEAVTITGTATNVTKNYLIGIKLSF